MKTSAVVLVLCSLLAAGCSGRTETKSKGHTYTVRARVSQLPSPQSGGLVLTHEAIDDWVGYSGKVEGMDTMTMPFPVAKGVSLEGIEPGDVVEVQLHADWTADPGEAVQITGVRELPRDARLDFRDAKPKP
jgi:Cu/Ag efflux protein CusF